MAEPIAAPATGANLLQQLLGSQTNTSGTSNQLVQALQAALTQGSTTGAQAGTQSGTSGASTVNTAELGPLLQAFQTSSAGMTPESMQALITSIFQEGARAVPELTGQFANSTGSRVRGNSGLNLALGDLNRSLSTQAAQAVLQNNQQSQSTAAQIAANIAANTRATQQTGTTQQANQGTTQQQQVQQQQQTGTTSTAGSTQQRAATTANPNTAALLGLGGTALNFLDKKGAFDSLFGRGGGGAGTIGTGGITSAVGNPAPTYGSAGTAGFSTSPAASSGFLQGPAASAPTISATAPAAGGGFSAPSYSGGVSAPAAIGGDIFYGGTGITGLGGFGTGAGGYLGQSFDYGSLPTSANYFGLGSSSDLGSNLSFGSNPFSYGGSSEGITGAVGMTPDAGGGFFGGLGDFGSGLLQGGSDFFSGIGDFIGGFFADGGQVGNRGFGSPGDTRYGGGGSGAAMNPSMAGVRDPGALMRREMLAGTMARPMTLQQGTNVMVPPGTPTGVPVNAGSIASLIPFLASQLLGFSNGGMVGGQREPSYAPGGYADGGQIQTGATAPRVRNQNYMGAMRPRDRTEALNYEGYAPAAASTSGVGASLPAGGSPSMGGGGGAAPAAMAAPSSFQYEDQPGFIFGGPQGMTPISTGAVPTTMDASNPINYTAAAIRQAIAQQAAVQAAQAAAYQQAGAAGGSGGVGEGAAPGQNEADNGQAGIGPSGIASAPQGTASAVSTGLGMAGMPAPGLSTALSAMMALAIAVNQANQQAAAATQAAAAGGGPGGSPGAAASPEGAVSSPVSQSNVVGIDIGPVGGIGGDSGGTGAASAGNAGTGSAGDTGEGDGAGPGGGGGAGSGAGGDYADGGIVRGAGTGTSDSIVAKSRQPGGKDIRYSDGEFVIPTDVVEMLGADHFQRLIDAFHTPAAAQA